jgi:hypothetical protein
VSKLTNFISTSFKKALVGTVALSIAASPVLVSAQTTTSVCNARGYTVGFFNGVWNTNTQDGALSGLNALQALIGTTYKSEPVEYQLFYNNTGSTVGATGAQDVAEVFVQRAREFDASGELGKRFEYFWEAASDGDKPFFSRLWNTFAAEAGIIDGMYSAVVTKAMAGWSLLLSNPPTSVNQSQHRLQLDTLAAEGQKLLLVAHSQGNLFVNPAYNYVKPLVGSTSVAAVHIAPASIALSGDYVLADIDVVINGLRVQGAGSVPATNIALPFSTADLSGHTLVGTYLDSTRAARARVSSMTTTALNSLTTPTAIASRGFFTATLTWDGTGDVDLHAFEPGGSHVYYSATTGSVGYLDVDNTVANGPEHYYASCDASKLATGIYTLGINNYSGATGRTATVQISFAQGGQALTRSLSVGAVRGSGGNSTPIQVFTVNVTKDANGKFTATAN